MPRSAAGPGGRRTHRGERETSIPANYIASPPSPLYSPGMPPARVRAMHTYMQAEIPAGIANPVVGRYSKTDSTKGPTINKAFDDGVNSIIVGRKPYSDLSGLVADWRKNGGNTIRHEYERQT